MTRTWSTDEEASADRIRHSNLAEFFAASSCSQIRSTRQPRCVSMRFTFRSRCALRASLAVQNAMRDLGTRLCCGQQCQKQPSTKTVSFCMRKTKSGLPGNDEPRRQPVMRCSRKNPMSRSSVARFSRDRTRDIRSERSTVVSVSISRVESLAVSERLYVGI